MDVRDSPAPLHKRQISKAAIASFVLAMPGILLLVFATVDGNLRPNVTISPIYTAPFAAPTIAAFVCGMLAVNKIKRSPNLKGEGLAIAGLVMASLTLIPALIVLYFFAALILHLYVT
jgi:hypothetical protein